MELNEKQFMSGFNSGYILAKFEPSLLTSLLRNMQPMNSYVQGMALGQKEYQLSKSDPELNELQKIRQRGKDHRDLERD